MRVRTGSSSISAAGNDAGAVNAPAAVPGVIAVGQRGVTERSARSHRADPSST